MKTLIIAAILISGCTTGLDKPSHLMLFNDKTGEAYEIAIFPYLGGEGSALCDYVRAELIRDYPKLQANPHYIYCEKR